MAEEKLWNEARLLELIAQSVGESDVLEFKGADAFERTPEKLNKITRTVSAFANANGGVVIYGMAQHDRFASEIDPIDASKFSPEWVDQVLNQIEPRIIGVRTKVVALSSAKNHVAYVLEIPKGETAHQARDDRYYRRYNFEALPMRDHEIRDVMGRRRFPKITATWRVVLKRRPTAAFQFNCVYQNEGLIMARHATCVMEIPTLIDRWYAANPADWPLKGDEEGSFFLGHRDLTETRPLFPNLPGAFELRVLASYTPIFDFCIHQARPLKWTFYADDMPPLTNSLTIPILAEES
jgi:hypothetical protein